jgi:alanine racemase
MTHFSDADGPAGVAAQMQVFEKATQDLPGERTTCNSAASLRHGAHVHVSADWVRPGIALYGGAPDFPQHTIADWNLQPTMSLRSQIIAIQNLQAGDAVGYGSAFRADNAMRIGVVACGYADGYPRHCPTGTPVLVSGVRTRTVGRISMDMVTVDLTPCDKEGVEVGFGTEVTLWGKSSSGVVLPIDEVAQAAGTVGYELMCAVANRVGFVQD